MNNNDIFADIRPSLDSEVPQVIQSLLADKRFENAVKFVTPHMNWEAFAKTLQTFTTKKEFQTKIVAPLIEELARKTITNLCSSGWEKFDNHQAHIFISNHRDIILDAGILNVLRNGHGLSTTEIAIGDNLFVYPWIEKLVRINKSFVVKRGVSIRQMMEVSKHLSEYIHHTITERGESVWIAQREGRAKDSDDRTQESLLKMLTLVPNSHLPLDSLQELNIVPLAISYQYDPCDYLKAAEFQLKRDNPQYKKTQIDDLKNMETGLLGFKGEVHFQFGRPLNEILDYQRIQTLSKKEIFPLVAQTIDREIHLNYKLFEGNYIAYDWVYNANTFSHWYTQEDKERFMHYVQEQVSKINIPNKDHSFLIQKIMEMYSNVVKNNKEALDAESEK